MIPKRLPRTLFNDFNIMAEEIYIHIRNYYSFNRTSKEVEDNISHFSSNWVLQREAWFHRDFKVGSGNPLRKWAWEWDENLLQVEHCSGREANKADGSSLVAFGRRWCFMCRMRIRRLVKWWWLIVAKFNSFTTVTQLRSISLTDVTLASWRYRWIYMHLPLFTHTLTPHFARSTLNATAI